MDLERLVQQARAGDLSAFTEVVRRFQHMAFGSALSSVRDFQQAEDVVQEAFVAAWFGLPSLAEPAAFPGWLRGIVRHQAHRVLRRRHLEAVPLSVAEGVADDAEPTPDRYVEERREAGAVIAAVAGLPAVLREVVTLYYVHECSQQDIATFLGLPVTTVNNRLHAGRVRLKRRMLAMVKETFKAHRLPDDFGGRIGRIVRTRERVVEARFDPDTLPEVLAELAVSDEAGRRSIAVQVVQRRGDGLVRAVAVSPIERFEPGMTVLSPGRLARDPVSREAFERVVQSLAASPAAPAAPPRLLETGIGQPFFVAEPYTHRPGVAVPMAEAVRGCREILDGRHDELPVAAFDFDGGIEDIVARARRR